MSDKGTEREQIGPALTAEQWAQPYKHLQAMEYDSTIAGAAEIVSGPGYLDLTSHERGLIVRFDTPDMQRALIALANHALPDSDPRKITSAKLDRLRLHTGIHDDEERGFLAALSSYLPPE